MKRNGPINVALLAGPFVVMLAACPQRGGQPQGSAAEEGARPVSRHGRLTSEQWAYGSTYVRRDLRPVANTNPHPEPQPHRDHPYKMALSPDGGKLYITLPGNEAEPGTEVSVYGVREGKVLRRVRVGSRPWAAAMHPGGRHLLVTNLYSNYISVIDVTTDRVVAEIPADFYCQEVSFSSDGRRAWIANRYLGQLLLADLRVDGARLTGRVVPRPGFDDSSFLAASPEAGSVREVLQRGCGSQFCHDTTRSGFYAGTDGKAAFISAVENSVPGFPDRSMLLRAVLPMHQGGFADNLAGANRHGTGQAVLERSSPDYQVLAQWIAQATDGPGVPVGNEGSRPTYIAVTDDDSTLFVGNLGTQDISVVDTKLNKETTAIYIQNVPLYVTLFRDQATDARWLFVASMGLGFGAPKERDPYGGETLDRESPLAQFSCLRDPKTAEPLPMSEQRVLGPFEAVDGTAAFKMRDIQNDIVAINLNMLRLPGQNGTPLPKGASALERTLLANRYEAHDAWVRYTSDSAEALHNDIHGDIPPDLMRVVGAFPASMEVSGRDLWVVMHSTYELVRYRIDPNPIEPSDLLTPIAVFETGKGPRALAVGSPGTAAAGLVFVSNWFGETLTVLDVASGRTKEVAVGDLEVPVPYSNAERGELFVNTAVFAVDQDTSCTSCHIYDTSDDRTWGAGQVIAQSKDGQMVSGGVLAIPQLRNLFAIQPFYFEGTHTAFDAQLDDAREHVAAIDFVAPVPGGDFTAVHHPAPLEARRPLADEVQEKVSWEPLGPEEYDLEERRDEYIRQQTLKHFGKAFIFKDFQRFIGDYQAAETRLLPNPFDQNAATVSRGRSLFGDTRTACVTCHTPPTFSNKNLQDKGFVVSVDEKMTLPQLVTLTRRDGIFTLFSPSAMDRINEIEPDVEPWNRGRVETEEGRFTSFQLRGIFDRPRSFLHHGRAVSLNEVLAAPGSDGLAWFKYDPLRGGERIRPNNREKAFNETTLPGENTFLVDTHGGTSHLNASELRDLANMLLAIE